VKNDTDIVKYEEDKCTIRATDDNLNTLKENIFKNIKLDNITNLLSEIKKSGLYRFVNNSEGGYLYINADGTTSGVLRKEGTTKIHEFGKLEKGGIDIGNVFKIVANQAMFAYIIVQLDEINQKLDLILEGQHNDRIARIKGAIEAYEHFDGRECNTEGFVSEIEIGISQLRSELNQMSNKLDPNAKFKDNWPKANKEKEIKETYNKFVEAVGWIFKGYQTLLKIDSKNNKMTGAEHLIEFLETGKWKELAKLARGLPYKKSEVGYPEERWEKINTEKPFMIKNLRNMIEFEKRKINEYIIEFTGEHLLEVLK
jgi:tetrahydromethanopterin S-methyltransferase subunit B